MENNPLQLTIKINVCFDVSIIDVKNRYILMGLDGKQPTAIDYKNQCVLRCIDYRC